MVSIRFHVSGIQAPGLVWLQSAPHKACLSKLLAGLRIYSKDTNLLHSRLLQLKECLCCIRSKTIIQRLEPLPYKDCVFKMYTSLTVKTVSRLFLPVLKQRGFLSTYSREDVNNYWPFALNKNLRLPLPYSSFRCRYCLCTIQGQWYEIVFLEISSSAQRSLIACQRSPSCRR